MIGLVLRSTEGVEDTWAVGGAWGLLLRFTDGMACLAMGCPAVGWGGCA